ncbi:hypothetical protein Scep_015811 [Stephania cephalantha]|uniref:Uncharacterized protein n=1 Tax=Stephania cephalantha TaxID=152367 RepID=A0AAP0J4N5_9MAGN
MEAVDAASGGQCGRSSGLRGRRRRRLIRGDDDRRWSEPTGKGRCGGGTRSDRGVTGMRWRWRRDRWEEAARGGGERGDGAMDTVVEATVDAAVVHAVGGSDD